MAWFDPRTWLAGEDPTALMLNQQLRDNFKAIGDPWTAYTPVWAAATTAPVIGNGTVTGAFMQAGKYVAYRFAIVSGTSTTYGAGTYTVTLPVAAVSPFRYPFGQLMCLTAGSTFYARTLMSTGSATAISATDTAGTRWSATSPFTPTAATAGQAYQGYGVYEAA